MSQPDPILEAVEQAVPSNAPQASTTFLDEISKQIDAIEGGEVAPASQPKAAVEAPPPGKEPDGTEAEVVDPVDDALGKEPANDEVDDTPPPQAQAKWTELKRENKAYRKQLEELKAEAERAKAEAMEAKAKASDPEVQAAKQRLEELEREIAVHRIEATAIYKNEVEKPAQAIIASLEQIAARNEDVDVDSIVAAFREPDAKKQAAAISAATENMLERDRLRVWDMADKFGEISKRHQEIKANAGEALKEAQAREAEAETLRKSKLNDEVKRGVVKSIEALKTRLPQLSEDADEHERIIDGIAAQLSDGQIDIEKPEVRAFAGVSAALIKPMVAALRKRDAEIAELRKTLDKYQGSSPRAGGGQQSASTPREGETAFDAMNRKLAEAFGR